ncbi:unnamed protein product [Pieris macdunnoughi]|uniref:DNA repair protein SWI5 homolog n=1 Tax=Pieris macdunnoughi TaxID=345717 RepID=A0A821N3H6_9NEOP|nr:unnamed protein product [Pieris macdunnoughi]
MSKNKKDLYTKLLEEELKIDKLLNDDKNQIQVKLLHQYNNIKDATQIVINHIANLEGTTLTDIHKKLNLEE